MTPDEVMRLRPPQKSGNGSSEQITAPGDMLIFVSGHFPILGMQMLYFFDPELKRRSELAPPTELPRLEAGAIGTQTPIHPTNHDLSEPEDVTSEEGITFLEQGFLEELRTGGSRVQQQE